MTPDDNAPTPSAEDLAGFDWKMLNPNQWEEPKEDVFARITKAEVAHCNEKYMAATTYRPALPRPIWQLHIEGERLDAEILLLDGRVIPAPLYAGCDLEKLDKDKGTIGPLLKRPSKEKLTLDTWTAKIGAITPENLGKLVGQVWHFHRYPSKEISKGRDGRAFTATNVVLPVEPMAPGWTYSGEVRRFEQKRDADSDGDVTSAAAAFGGTPAMSSEDAARAIGDFLAKHPELDPGDNAILGHPEFPTDARVEPFVSATALGDLVETLNRFGVEV